MKRNQPTWSSIDHCVNSYNAKNQKFHSYAEVGIIPKPYPPKFPKVIFKALYEKQGMQFKKAL